MLIPKSKSAVRFFIITILVSISHCVFSQSGKDGAMVVTAGSIVVNQYTELIANANIGATSIQVSSNAMINGSAGALSIGDLIYIIQVQGASINNADNSTYGNVTSYNNCGKSEFVEVSGIVGNFEIDLSCPLQNNYDAAGKVVVLRVPRYTTLTLNSGSSITCPVWNGANGGIVAIEVAGATTINSGASIDASGKGFRGGSILDNLSAFGVLNWVYITGDYGAEKGESVAGSSADYDNIGGRFCKGAPANGGGGGNGHNAGGGGGSNAGVIANYTGNGNPDNSNASWAAAWNLESAGFSASTSSGGGKGGYTFSSSNQNALTAGPSNPAWGGDSRKESGGRGGRPLDYSTGRIFMGGGGGAGDQNDSKGGRGGNGGGIINIVTYGAINGSGQVSANGDNGFNTLTTNGTDGAGGGGGGGTIIVNTTSTVNGITLYANGGNGGMQNVQLFTLETEGPGGGGGGGYIAITGGAPVRTANGGINGTTNSLSLTEFPPNGATKGGEGINNAVYTPFRIITQTVNLCSAGSTTLTFTTQGNAPAGVVYSWYDQPVGGTLLGTGTTYTTPVISTSQTYYIKSCPGFSRVPIQVNVSNSVSASITANSSVCAGNPMNFAATGTANIVSWVWDFGDGTPTVAQQNPTHTYANNGSFQVLLTVSDGSCTVSYFQTVTVNSAPAVNFTSSATGNPCGSLTVQFTNSTTGGTSYSWNFGDGSAANTQTSPSHTYGTSGTYNVVLTAAGSGCTSTHSLSITIGPRPLASFTMSSIHCQNETINFNNLSVGNGSPITSYSWNFGDGSPFSSVQNPSHIYTGPGSFNVTLTANTSGCNDDTTITIIINPTPAANFTVTPLTGCAPLTTVFNNLSTGTLTNIWNFGDGSAASTQSNPSHTYSSAGNYTVTLIASANGCTDTMISSPNLISVSTSPTAAFTAASGICLGDSLHLTNSSNGNGSPITSNTWDFGDGSPNSTLVNPSHAYAASGTYSVHLTVSTAGCTDDTTITVNVSPGPVAAFSAPATSACGSLLASFINTTTGSPSYTWNFGDGSSNSNLAAPTHTYTVPGTYTVTLIAVQGSCSDTLQMVNYIHLYSLPLSSFNASNVCTGDSVRFNDLSNGNNQTITSYSWTFGDGGTSSIASPSHLYASSGTYIVNLTINTALCSDDTAISVTVNPVPTISFSSNITNACDSATVLFSNASTGASTYNWLFGDGGTSSSSSPSHVYTSPGSYTVVLTASAAGCSITQTRLSMIDIHSTPVAAFSATSTNICKGDCISFINQSSSDVTSWVWTFPGASPASSNAQQPGNICYSASTSYDVTLQVSNGFCSQSQTMSSYIDVIDCSVIPHAGLISSDTSICGGSCINFVDVSVNAQNWQWLFPGANPSSSSVENPVNICYGSQGSYSVTLIVGNPAGHDTVTYSNFIQVAAGLAAPIITQNGNTLTSSPASQYQWYLNNVAISGAISQQYIAMLSGDYYVMITDANGCTAISAVKHVSLVGIEETETDFLFSIYPNPAVENITVSFHSKKPLNLTLLLFDDIGRQISFTKLNMNSAEESFQYNLKDLAKGIYFLQVLSDEINLTKAIFKNP